MRYSDRPLTIADAPFVIALHAKPHAREFIITPTEENIRRALDRPGFEGRIVLAGDEPVGHFTLTVHFPWFVEAGLVAASEPRRGIGTYVLERIVTRAFSELRAHRLYLETTDDNLPMQTLLKKFGFTHEGTFRHGTCQDDGTYKDLRAYGMLESDPGARVNP